MKRALMLVITIALAAGLGLVAPTPAQALTTVTIPPNWTIQERCDQEPVITPVESAQYTAVATWSAESQLMEIVFTAAAGYTFTGTTFARGNVTNAEGRTWTARRTLPVVPCYAIKLEVGSSVRGTVTPADSRSVAGLPVQLEVWTNSRWSALATLQTQTGGDFATDVDLDLALTYPRIRAKVTVAGKTYLSSNVVTLTDDSRVRGPRIMWMYTKTPVGYAGSVQAVVDGAWDVNRDEYRQQVDLQVLYRGGWATVGSAASSFEFSRQGIVTIPLAYGVGTSGTYTFRLKGDFGISPHWTVTRGPSTQGEITFYPGDRLIGRATKTGGMSLHYTNTGKDTMEDVQVWLNNRFPQFHYPYGGEVRQLVEGGETLVSGIQCGAAGYAGASVHITGEFTMPGAPQHPGWYTSPLQTKPVTIPSLCAEAKLMSAPPVLLIGQTGTARAQVLPMTAGLPGFVEVLHNGAWVRIASGYSTSQGTLTLPLAYGVATPGTYTFRLGTINNGAIAYTTAFKVTRVGQPSVALMSAPATTRVGQAGTAWGRVTPAQGSTGYLDVLVNGTWRQLAVATPSSAGDFRLALAYGVSIRGTYTFRLRAVVAGKAATTRLWTVTRT